MCGIFGYYNRQGRSVDSSTLISMGDAIRYRGPDDRGLYEGDSWALGNQRLAIIDIAGGHQPFISDDGRIVVVQNGEIFNHVELSKEASRRGNPCRTQSDTEVILRLYELEGINCLHRLNGMFAIAIHDASQNIMFLARDRVGVKPLYFHDDGRQLTFASEIKSILQDRHIDSSLDEEALHHYLTFNYVPPPHTIYRGIRHLMPGHYMKIGSRRTDVKKWWDLADVEPVYGRTEEQWIEEFNFTLDDAVRLRLRSDVPFGAFLSGGVDSSSVVGLMARHMTEPVKTFCIGFDDPRYDESSFAQEAAERFSTEHVMKRVSPDMLDIWPFATHHCDQPHGDISFLPTYRVSQLAAEHVKVVLTGDGGDELFAGYDKYQSFFSRPGINSMTDAEFEREYFASISLFSDQAKASVMAPAFRERMTGNNSFEVVRPYFAELKHQDRINQALYVDMQLLLSGNNLVKPDRMGMAMSLEARTPFLDYRMMELAFRMPGHLKLKDGVTKYIYKKAVAPLIGAKLAYRKKQMFTVPVGDWFRTTKLAYCQEKLKTLDSQGGLFSTPYITDILNRHVAGEDFTRQLRALIAFAIWHDVNKPTLA
ncbi:asparagine synthase (glutamine-hydrolyzing) [Pollutimonas thiosulfatoxidans]|uniref:asparagine synthase (glutamine-hydrolyzing) n=1 Tax=Pollutimonas thiosulfatoxidans TaxID=2028345 RepID=A0A410GEI4_9BURK|nr:asparagine synthase (glutamine-hydrolyzing) [Pollutimonas thiosulfatoxidans]QAA94704.1 asparagine synthase (glutamine-hydrolyzing) [Pollutimonas thiosulfatoxidans]